MSTKITGIGDDGMPTTTGDTGTLVTDGSLVIGNADTDSVTFNADIASHLVPDANDTYLLGSSSKSWRVLYFSDSIIRKSQNGPGFTSVGFVDPGQSSFAITVPARNGTLALEGLLPSLLGFGKNGAQSAPVTNYELTTVNGAQNAQGWRMPVDGFITNISCQFDVSNSVGTNIFQIALWKNGVEQASQYITLLTNLSNGDNGISHAYNPPLAFTTNDTITLKLTLAKGTSSSLRVEDLACLLRILN